VLIPVRNLQNLMLNDEVLEAVEAGELNVRAVDTVEEGIQVLTGVPAGHRQDDGRFPDDTVYGRADRRLREMAEVLKEYGPAARAEDEPSGPISACQGCPVPGGCTRPTPNLIILPRPNASRTPRLLGGMGQSRSFAQTRICAWGPSRRKPRA